MDRVFLSDLHSVIVLASGRLLILGGATGHPSFVRSFVFIHEPGAGAAWCVEVLVGNHGLQKRPPPLAVTFFRTGNKHVSLAPNYRVLKNPVWCGFTWKEVHRWFEGGLGRIAVVHVHDRGTGRHGFRANSVHLDAFMCNCVHELLAKLVQCIRYSSVCLLPA